MMCKLMPDGLLCFSNKLQFVIYDVMYKNLQLICKGIFSLSQLLGTVIKITDLRTDSLTRLRH